MKKTKLIIHPLKEGMNYSQCYTLQYVDENGNTHETISSTVSLEQRPMLEILACILNGQNEIIEKLEAL